MVFFVEYPVVHIKNMQFKGSKHLINLSIDRIILKWIIKNHGWRMRAGFVGLRIGSQ
jgi:hypothetical protein